MKILRNLIISIILIGGITYGGWYYYNSLFIEVPTVKITIKEGDQIKPENLTYVKIKKDDINPIEDYILDIGHLNNKVARFDLEPKKPILKSRVYDSSEQREENNSVEFTLPLDRVQTIDNSINAGNYVFIVGFTKNTSELIAWEEVILVTKKSELNGQTFVTFLAEPKIAIEILQFSEQDGNLYLLLSTRDSKLDLESIQSELGVK
ncbi:SAF domain-containing protein (plasmid) [Mycoplasmatota bacterium]|nr:SAF domain-containing protein [Mycoplasmatota bacterium]